MANLKNSRAAHTVRKIPGLLSSYHFVWAWTGAQIHHHPSRKMFIIGVTGTKGKTTTLEVLNAILEAAGKKTALLSSLRMKIGDESRKSSVGNSMPGHGYIQKFLRAAKQEGCNYALIEVTSQGVVLHRHRFIRWNIGALTNLSPEHIEAHGSFENYRAAKLAFLQYVVRVGGKVFLNRDDKNFPFFFEALEGGEPVSFSQEEEGFRWRMGSLENTHTRGGFLLSPFNRENIAAAVAIAKEIGVRDDVIDRALAGFAGLPGRMEFVRRGPYTAIVDYAHTPDSLEAAYRAAKPVPSPEYPSARLICVLGAAGGGRDKWKRPQMGSIAAQYCSEIVLTDEDPYEEDPREIVDEVRQGIGAVPGERAPVVHVEMDRAAAIKKAVSLMHEGDVVIGTGKGSEDYIHVANGNKVPWNERAAFEAALDERLK